MRKDLLSQESSGMRQRMNSSGVEVLLYLNIPMLSPDHSVLKGVIRNSSMKKSV